MKDRTTMYYNKYGKKWVSNKTNSFHLERQFRIFSSLLAKGARVINIGCAGGIHVPMFLGIGRHFRYEGIDASKTMIAIARSRYPQLPFTVADIKDMRRNPKGDAFWASAVLMHTENKEQERMFHNIEKQMKPGAIGFISLPEDRPNNADDIDQRTFTLYTRKRFIDTITNRGWIVLKKGSYDSGNSVTAKWNWYIVQLPT